MWLCEQTYVLTNNNKNNDKLCITGRLFFLPWPSPHWMEVWQVNTSCLSCFLCRFPHLLILFLWEWEQPLHPPLLQTKHPPSKADGTPQDSLPWQTAKNSSATARGTHSGVRPLNSVDHNLIKYLLQYHHRTAPEAERSCLDRSELLWWQNIRQRQRERARIWERIRTCWDPGVHTEAIKAPLMGFSLGCQRKQGLLSELTGKSAWCMLYEASASASLA